MDARRRVVVPAVHGRHGGRRSTCPAPTTSRWRRRGTSQALGDGEVPLEFLFSGTVFYAGPQGLLQTGDDRLGPGGRVTRCRCAPGGRRWTRHFAGTRVAAALARDASTASSPTARATSWRAGTRPSMRCCPATPASDGPRAPDRRRRPLRGLRAVALPPLGAQEPAALDLRRRPSRAPTARSAAATTRGSCRRSACSRAGRTRRFDVHVRFLHVVERQVLRTAAAGSSPSTSSSSAASATCRGRRRSSARSAQSVASARRPSRYASSREPSARSCAGRTARGRSARAKLGGPRRRARRRRRAGRRRRPSRDGADLQHHPVGGRQPRGRRCARRSARRTRCCALTAAASSR